MTNLEITAAIRKTGGLDKGRNSQGTMRDLRDAGLMIEYPDHSFILTDAGRAILRSERAR